MTKSRSNATAPNAKGTLVVGTGTDASTTLAVASTAGWLLSVDSAETTGLKWAAPSGGTWTTYTPSWTNLTVGNATVTARYLNSNKVCYFGIKLVFGSTTSVSGRPTFTLPVTAASQAAAELAVGFSAIQDDGVGNWLTDIYPNAATTTTMGIIPYKANDTYVKFDANISSTVPFTWATNDVIWVSGYYEVA